MHLQFLCELKKFASVSSHVSSHMAILLRNFCIMLLFAFMAWFEISNEIERRFYQEALSPDLQWRKQGLASLGRCCLIENAISPPNPDWKVCLARPISLPRTLNFSRGSSSEIFVKQQKETIEQLFSDTNTAAQAFCMKERSPAHSANFPIWHQTVSLRVDPLFQKKKGSTKQRAKACY